MNDDMNDDIDPMKEVWMSVGEVAKLFSVDPKTVTRWGTEGAIPFIKTAGGHRRYPRSVVEKLIRGGL